jgi:hypothetical protein
VPADVRHLVAGGRVVVEGALGADNTILAYSVRLDPVTEVGTLVRAISPTYGFYLRVDADYYQVYLSPDTHWSAKRRGAGARVPLVPGTRLTVTGYYSPPRALLAVTIR